MEVQRCQRRDAEFDWTVVGVSRVVPRGQVSGTSYAPIQSDASAESLTSDAPLCVNGLVTGVVWRFGVGVGYRVWRYGLLTKQGVWVKKNPPWGFLAFFPKRLRIFNQFFAHLLYVPIYARLQIFIQLSPTVDFWASLLYQIGLICFARLLKTLRSMN